MPRGSLARAYLHKYSFDCDHEKLDLNSWYSVPEAEAGAMGALSASFVRLDFDSETGAFLDAAKAQSDSVCLQLWYNVAVWCLSWGLSKTSINGLLGRGSMFIFSRAQLGRLLSLPDDRALRDQAVLDLGAGDGRVTAVLQQHFPKVLVTEASQPMLWRLAERGFEVLDLRTWQDTQAPIHLISALNLIDRHPTPLLLLSQLRALSLRNGGCPILLGAVFPWYQYSEFSDSHVPKDSIRLHPGTFAEQVSEFAEAVLGPAGLAVERWARAPYLCEGDAYQSYYILFDALFVLRPV